MWRLPGAALLSAIGAALLSAIVAALLSGSVWRRSLRRLKGHWASLCRAAKNAARPVALEAGMRVKHARNGWLMAPSNAVKLLLCHATK